MITKKISNYLFIIFNIPSTIVLIFLLVFKMIKHYKVDNEFLSKIINEEYRQDFIREGVEDYKPIGKHINYSFWILIIYIIFS
jgi:anaerobic C4-dicarboxylate transporter